MSVPLNTLIRPMVAYLAGTHRVPGGAPAEAMLIAIGLQESRFEARDQLEVQDGRLVPGAIGPATGFWQFERAGGVRGVMRHAASRVIAQAMATEVGVEWDETAIWTLFTRPEGDELACVFARLLLLTDPQPLPAAAAENEESAWAYYLRNWRPGKPHRATWGGFWRQAVGLAAGASETPLAAAPAQAAPRPDLEARVAALEARMAAIGRAAA